jgi:hypothetical protein
MTVPLRLTLVRLTLAVALILKILSINQQKLKLVLW